MAFHGHVHNFLMFCVFGFGEYVYRFPESANFE